MSSTPYWNPFDHAVVDNPYPAYRVLRDDAPVYHNEEVGFWAISRFDDVLAAHLDTDTYSSAHGTTIERFEVDSPFLIAKDPPIHTWHRKIVSRVFTPRRINGLEPFIRSKATELLDPHVGSDGFDAIADYSIRLPLEVISELIDLPVELREEVHVQCEHIAARPDGEVTEPEAAMQASATLQAMLAGLARERRRNPGDDVISLLIETPVVDDDGTERFLDDDELGYRFIELAFAGHETVAKLIPNGIVALAWYPDQRAELAADPSLLPDAVEEMLRWDPPSHYQGRWTTRDVELHGTTIPAEQRVVLITGAATHDERRFDDPELFDIHRHIERHVTFGFGNHLCLGAALARLETRIAFEELLARFPEYEIATAGVTRAYSSNVRGLGNLPLVV
jgi:cytochrome P450